MASIVRIKIFETNEYFKISTYLPSNNISFSRITNKQDFFGLIFFGLHK